MPRVLFDRDYFSTPNALVKKWSWTQLDPICFVIFSAYLEIAYGSPRIFPKNKTIAAQLGISVRNLQRRHREMEEKGMLRTIRTQGGVNTIDLNPIKGYLERLTPPVEKLPYSSPTPDTRVMGGGDTRVMGGIDENKGKGEQNRVDGGLECGGNNTNTNIKLCRNNQSSVESSLKSSDLSTPESTDPLTSKIGSKGNGAGKEPWPAEAVLSDLAFVVPPDLPVEIQKHRRTYLEGIGTLRQRVETMLRLELRALGIRTRVINRWFQEVPVDGILFYLTKAYGSVVRDRAAWLVGVIKRTGGAYERSIA